MKIWLTHLQQQRMICAGQWGLYAVVRATLPLLSALLWLWTILAIHYSQPNDVIRIVLSVLFGLGVPTALVCLSYRRRTWKCFLVAFLPVLCWWLTIQPSNERAWSPDQVVLPYAETNGDRAIVHNVRNCSYNSTTDYTVSHEDRTYDLNDLETVWFIVEPLSGWRGVAHTFLSFGFADGRYLAVSVEIRKEKGERFSALKGFFKQYEIMYVIGDERDLIGLRANQRNHPVHLYPVRATRATIRELFTDMLDRANELVVQPEFYNTLTNTCTTNIVDRVNRPAKGTIPYSPDVVFPGFSDKLAYDLGLIDTELPFEEAKRRFQINDLAHEYADHPDFSTKIRARHDER